MPRVVDHEDRRRTVADAALRVIERVGVENARLRDIADEIGCSTGSLTHYFRSKDELIGFAFQQISEMAFEGIQKATERADPGLGRLRISLDRLLPHSGAKGSGSLVSLSFWGHAATNPSLAEIHRAAYAKWRGFVRRFLVEAIEAGQIAPATDVDDTVTTLVALVDGLLVSKTLEPKLLPKNKPNLLLEAMLDRLKLAPVS